MKWCQYCGKLNPDVALYCGNCGRLLDDLYCPNCNTLNPANNIYCFNCGKLLPRGVQFSSQQKQEREKAYREGILLARNFILIGFCLIFIGIIFFVSRVKILGVIAILSGVTGAVFLMFSFFYWLGALAAKKYGGPADFWALVFYLLTYFFFKRLFNKK